MDRKEETPAGGPGLWGEKTVRKFELNDTTNQIPLQSFVVRNHDSDNPRHFQILTDAYGDEYLFPVAVRRGAGGGA